MQEGFTVCPVHMKVKAIYNNEISKNIPQNCILYNFVYSIEIPQTNAIVLPPFQSNLRLVLRQNEPFCLRGTPKVSSVG